MRRSLLALVAAACLAAGRVGAAGPALAITNTTSARAFLKAYVALP